MRICTSFFVDDNFAPLSFLSDRGKWPLEWRLGQQHLLRPQALDVHIVQCLSPEKLRARHTNADRAVAADASQLLIGDVARHACDRIVDVLHVQPVSVVAQALVVMGRQLRRWPDAILRWDECDIAREEVYSLVHPRLVRRAQRLRLRERHIGLLDRGRRFHVGLGSLAAKVALLHRGGTRLRVKLRLRLVLGRSRSANRSAGDRIA
jgi:hypothetical protein